jgi:hypothetical protein
MAAVVLADNSGFIFKNFLGRIELEVERFYLA